MQKQTREPEVQIFNSDHPLKDVQITEIAGFLYRHLGKYGDSVEDITRSINYALQQKPGAGGFILVARQDDSILGIVVINHTGMRGYIPENILVYIAIHQEQRGMGFGKWLMKHALKEAKGNIALHVEPDNPARHLYEKLGFQSKYLEMRLNR